MPLYSLACAAVTSDDHSLKRKKVLTRIMQNVWDECVHDGTKTVTSTVDAMLTESKTNVLRVLSVSRVLRLNYELQHQLYTCFLKSSSDWIVIDDCVRALRVVPY